MREEEEEKNYSFHPPNPISKYNSLFRGINQVCSFLVVFVGKKDFYPVSLQDKNLFFGKKEERLDKRWVRQIHQFETSLDYGKTCNYSENVPCQHLPRDIWGQLSITFV